MDEKTIQRIKKLQALAERGVGGEKTTAQKKLAKLLKDNGINSLDELQKEEYEYWQEMNRHGQRHNRKRVKRHEKGLYMQPIQGERRRRAGQKHRLCAAADTAGIRGRLSTHYAAFIYDAVHGR